MNKPLLWRLVLDLLSAGLLMVALAYYWLDNPTHEWIGLGLFGLLLAHNVLNRRWYRTVPRQRRGDLPGLFDKAMTLTLLLLMAVLLVTSVVVSQSVFGFLAIDDGFTARQLHAFAAYWALVLVALHIGIRWQRVMNAVRDALGLSANHRLRTLALRVLAAVLALHGLQSAVALGIGPKLTLQMSLEWWDFEASTAGFFLACLSFIALIASLSHYGLSGLRALPRRRMAAQEAATQDRLTAPIPPANAP